MAEGRKTHPGAQPGPHDGHPLELNWAGCDLYGRDLLDLDEVDSELLNFEAHADEAARDIFPDINFHKHQTRKGRRVSWGRVKEAHAPVSPRNVPGNVLSSASTRQSPEFPPTLLELEVQALAKIGVVKLYHNSEDLEQAEVRAEETRKLAIINRFDRERQALSPLPSHHREQRVQSPERGVVREVGKECTASMERSANATSTSPQTSGGGTDLLELQKVALSSMKGKQKLSAVASTSVPPPQSPRPLAGDGHLLELQRVALSSMGRTANQTLGGTAKGPPSREEGTDLLELQKVALASMKRLSEKVLSRSTTPVSGPVPQPSSAVGDLLELQRTALANIQNFQKKASPHPAPSTLQATALAKAPQQQAGGCDFLELQKVARRGIKTEPTPTAPQAPGDSLPLQKVALQCRCKGNESPPQPSTATQAAKGEVVALKCRCKGSETPPEPATTTQAAKGEVIALTCRHKGNESPPQLASVTQQARAGEDLLELQKVALRGIPKPPSQQAEWGGGDLFELQKVVLKNVPHQGAPSSPSVVLTHQTGRDLLDLQIVALGSVQSHTAPAQIGQQAGGDLSELQKAALTKMSSGKGQGGGIVVVPEDTELKRQNNTPGGGGTSPTSSPAVFNKMPAREPLEMLLQELSTKEQALQSASRTIEEKDQLLQEYWDSLANALNLLESVNVRCTDAKSETAKVLIEAEEICWNLRAACSAIDNIECSFPNCAIGILGSIATADDSHFSFGIEDGLDGNQVEIDERRNLVEELLTELRNIEVARRQAQEGCELQIQRNEQLIAELQQLDVAPPPPVSERATCDPEHVEQKPPRIARPPEVKTTHFQSTSGNKSPSDLVEGNLCDHANENPTDQAKESPCDHAYENRTDEATGNGCDHVYEDSSDQARENPCDHTYESHPNDQASEKPCVHVYESHPSDDKGKEKPCDHVYESHPSDVETNGKPCDHVYEIHTSDDKVNEKSCDHVVESPIDQAEEILCDHVYENPHDLGDGNSCDHTHDHSTENQRGHAYENPHDQSKEIACDHTSNPCNHTYEETNEQPCDHSYEQINEKPCDHAFQSSSEHSYENPRAHTFEIPFDHAYEDGKDCGPIHGWENIGSAIFNAPTWMGQITKSLAQVEANNSSEVRTIGPARQYKRHSHITGVSNPNALWEHLQHFVKNQPQSCDDSAKNEVIRILIQQQGDLELRTRELQNQLKQRTSEVGQLHEQTNQLQTALLQEQDDREKILLERTTEAPKADLEHKDKVIHKMHFQMHQLEAALREEREEMREALAQKTSQLEEAVRQEREEMRGTLAQKTKLMQATLNQEREEMREALAQKTNEMEATLRQEREEMREALAQKTREISHVAEATTLDPDLGAKEINELHQHLHQMQRDLEDKENIRKAWLAEKLQMTKCFEDLETKLLVKEEEVIQLTHELEMSRSSVYSQPDEVKFNKGENEGSHFFQKQGGKEDGREILDLRCEVLSLQDCLGIKTQAIKTMEKELGRSYGIVTELRSKVRSLQECERNPQRQGQNKELIERLRSTEEKLQKCLSQRAVMSNKIQDLSARCKHLEEFEHLHREGSDEMKSQAIKELEKELERNVQIITKLQTHCNEYEIWAKQAEARNLLESAGRSSDSGTYDSWEEDHSKLAQKEALAAECEQLRSQIKRKDQVIIQLQGNVQSLKTKQSPSSPSKYQQNALSSEDARSKKSKATNTLSITNSVLEHDKVEAQEVSTMKELLREQWKIQRVMEDRLNTMMAYLTDRVDEFERMSPSDATSDSSCPPPNTELNHFHVEAKLMKLQLEQQLQVLRGQAFTSLPPSGVTSPGQQCPQNGFSPQNMQLLSEKNALEDSAQTLQEKTSRLLNRLTVMRSEFGPTSR